MLLKSDKNEMQIKTERCVQIVKMGVIEKSISGRSIKQKKGTSKCLEHGRSWQHWMEGW